MIEVKPHVPTTKDLIMVIKDQCRALMDSIDYDLGDDLIKSHLNDINITVKMLNDKVLKDLEVTN